MDTSCRPTLAVDGFEEVAAGAAVGTGNSQSCSNTCTSHGCSAHCTQKCSLDETFAASADAWARFLAVEGGDVQF